MMGFGKPHLIRESTGNRLLIRIGRDVIVLLTAVCQLGSLATSKLLQRREWFFIFGSLTLHLLSTFATSRIAKSLKKLPPVWREKPHIGINGERGLKQDWLFSETDDEILSRAFLVASFQESAALHICSCFQLGYIQVELHRRFQLGKRIPEHRIWFEVQPFREREKRSDQDPIFVEKIGFFSL